MPYPAHSRARQGFPRGPAAAPPESPADDPAQARQRDRDCLTHAIDTDVIPRLAERHRHDAPAPAPGRADPQSTELFLAHVLAGRHGEADLVVARLREGGWSIADVYLGLLRPAAERIGDLWCDDLVDFAQATLATGRLQQMLRELSPAFAAEAAPAPQAWRALFVQADGEQHSFGLSMLAEFFRRGGWDVLGGVGTAGIHPVERVRREWFDLVGISAGSGLRLPWIRDLVAAAREASLNRRLVVLVGGPLFAVQPALAGATGADGTANDARDALALAEALVAKRQPAAGGGGEG